jgi:hypothetical protein
VAFAKISRGPSRLKMRDETAVKPRISMTPDHRRGPSHRYGKNKKKRKKRRKKRR